MIADIQDRLKDIDHHLDNIKELVDGLDENTAEEVLKSVITASDALDQAHALMIAEEPLEPLWDTEIGGPLWDE